MKPLTIEQLKELEVGDWVWIVNEKYNNPNKFYASKSPLLQRPREAKEWIVFGTKEYVYSFRYKDYGKTWFAYKNKEQAEAKGEIVELPCKVGDNVYMPNPNDEEIYISKITKIIYETDDYFAFDERAIGISIFINETEAEARLAELKGEKR